MVLKEITIMNKKWLISVTVTVFYITIHVGTAFAVGPASLAVNRQKVSPFSLKIEGSTDTAPDAYRAEALENATGYIDVNKTVKSPNKEQQDIEKRLDLLEFALISQSPEEVANTWARGVMSRNGALQYAVLSDNLKSKYKPDFEVWGWWTGSSSPWIDSYHISDMQQQSDGTWRFTFIFHYTDSTKISLSRTLNILVGLKKVDKPPLPVYPGTEQKWCVIRIG